MQSVTFRETLRMFVLSVVLGMVGGLGILVWLSILSGMNAPHPLVLATTALAETATGKALVIGGSIAVMAWGHVLLQWVGGRDSKQAEVKLMAVEESEVDPQEQPLEEEEKEDQEQATVKLTDSFAQAIVDAVELKEQETGKSLKDLGLSFWIGHPAGRGNGHVSVSALAVETMVYPRV